MRAIFALALLMNIVINIKNQFSGTNAINAKLFDSKCNKIIMLHTGRYFNPDLFSSVHDKSSGTIKFKIHLIET